LTYWADFDLEQGKEFFDFYTLSTDVD